MIKIGFDKGSVPDAPPGRPIVTYGVKMEFLWTRPNACQRVAAWGSPPVKTDFYNV